MLNPILLTSFFPFKLYSKFHKKSIPESNSRKNCAEIEKINFTNHFKYVTIKYIGHIGFNLSSFIKLVLELEDIFNIEFDDELLSYKKFVSFNNLCDYIDIRMQDKK